MKKIISYFLSGIVLCTALLVTPVSAAEVAPAEETITINSTVSVRATNYWTKTTTKLNSVYGTVSNISTVSSGSVSGSNPQILKIEVYSRVSSGSDSFYLYVEDGNGNVNYTTVSKSGTITINDFNGFDPSGKWKIWIVTKGTVATVYKGNIIKNLIMDCQSYAKYRPNETTGGIFVSWRRKEELPTGA